MTCNETVKCTVNLFSGHLNSWDLYMSHWNYRKSQWNYTLSTWSNATQLGYMCIPNSVMLSSLVTWLLGFHCKLLNWYHSWTYIGRLLPSNNTGFERPHIPGRRPYISVQFNLLLLVYQCEAHIFVSNTMHELSKQVLLCFQKQKWDITMQSRLLKTPST